MENNAKRIDHLVFATPDLQQGIDFIEQLLGVRASRGGSHPGWGTCNALLSLGESTYLEIIGPDPAQDPDSPPTLFNIDKVVAPQLVTWAAKCADLASRGVVAFADGQALGEIFPASRNTPEGETLSWHLSDPRVELEEGLLPFLIDWGDSSHPAGSAAPGATLVELKMEHPKPDRLAGLLAQLDLSTTIRQAPKRALVAVIDSPAGRVELR